MAKKMQKLFAMLLIGTVTLSATSLSALAVEYDISSGAVHVEADESGTNKSWQEGHDTHNSKENGSTDKEITITQSNSETTTSNTVNVGENVKDVTITLKDVNIQAKDGEAAVTVDHGADVTIKLDGENKLNGSETGAGLNVKGEVASTTDDGKTVEKEAASVTIKDANGTGSLTATGGSSGVSGGAGIGGSDLEKGGNITIESGTVTATGGYQAAGIGGGQLGGSGLAAAGGQQAGNHGQNQDQCDELFHLCFPPVFIRNILLTAVAPLKLKLGRFSFGDAFKG